VFARTSGCRKKPIGISVCFVPITEFRECPLRQGYITVFTSLTLFDVDDHSWTVDVGNFERAAFGEPESAGVDSQKTDTVNWETDALEDTLDFFTSEDNGESPLGFRTNEVKQGPFPLNGLGVEKLDATECDGHGCPFPFLDILDMQEVLAQIFFADLSGGFIVEVLNELAHRARVALLCSFGKSFELHVFEHALT